MKKYSMPKQDTLTSGRVMKLCENKHKLTSFVSYWFSWTCRLRLTPLTMTHFLQDFTLDMESVEQPSHGLDPILLTVINKLSFMAILLVRCLFNLVSLKGLFWDLCCLPCFLLPSKPSFQHMG